MKVSILLKVEGKKKKKKSRQRIIVTFSRRRFELRLPGKEKKNRIAVVRNGLGLSDLSYASMIQTNFGLSGLPEKPRVLMMIRRRRRIVTCSPRSLSCEQFMRFLCRVFQFLKVESIIQDFPLFSDISCDSLYKLIL